MCLENVVSSTEEQRRTLKLLTLPLNTAKQTVRMWSTILIFCRYVAHSVASFCNTGGSELWIVGDPPHEDLMPQREQRRADKHS